MFFSTSDICLGMVIGLQASILGSVAALGCQKFPVTLGNKVIYFYVQTWYDLVIECQKILSSENIYELE